MSLYITRNLFNLLLESNSILYHTVIVMWNHLELSSDDFVLVTSIG